MRVQYSLLPAGYSEYALTVVGCSGLPPHPTPSQPILVQGMVNSGAVGTVSTHGACIESPKSTALD
jgi:hypothetical protein